MLASLFVFCLVFLIHLPTIPAQQNIDGCQPVQAANPGALLAARYRLLQPVVTIKFFSACFLHT